MADGLRNVGHHVERQVGSLQTDQIDSKEGINHESRCTRLFVRDCSFKLGSQIDPCAREFRLSLTRKSNPDTNDRFPQQFHVSVRAAAPILTLVISLLFFSSTTTFRTSSSLLLVLLGISFTSLNEEWASLGSLLVILSTFLLTSKSLLTTHLLSDRFHLHPLDILARMSPLSMIHCALFAIGNGEVQKLWTFVRSQDFTRNHLLEIVLNGVLSFGVVVCGLVAERRTKPPALAITCTSPLHLSPRF